MSTVKKYSGNKTILLITILILIVAAIFVYVMANNSMKTASEQQTVTEPTDEELDPNHEEYQEPVGGY